MPSALGNGERQYERSGCTGCGDSDSGSNIASPDIVPTRTTPEGRTTRPNVLHSSEMRPLLASKTVHVLPVMWPTPDEPPAHSVPSPANASE